MPRPTTPMARLPDRPRFAPAARILRESLRALLPPQRITVSDHAARYRWLPSVTGGHLVHWDHTIAPYLTEPMEALSDDAHDTVAVIGPAASGKTMVAENWALHNVHADPADMLWYLHTDPAIETYVKGRIEPMLEAHDKLIADLRHGRDSVNFKRFNGGRFEFLSFTRSNLINKHVRKIVADEYDNYDPNLGNPMALLNPRRQAASAAGADSKVLLISHADRAAPIGAKIEEQAGIMAVYLAGDRRTWWWSCPHCGGFSSPNPGTPRHMALCYPEDAPLEEIEARAHLLCPVSGCIIEEKDRIAMLASGRWVGRGEECDEDGRILGQRDRMRIAGFWIVGVMSPFVMGGIGALARAREAARRSAVISGDERPLREVMVKSWGVPYAPPRQVGSIEAAELADRARPDLALGLVPPGCRVLHTSVDVQANRFELVTRGFGAGLESWVIEARHIPAAPATNPADWDDLMRLLAGLEYPLADASGRVMRVRGCMFDAMGEPGVTEQAYAAWRRAKKARLVRYLGRIDGRPVHSIMPSKGAAAPQHPALVVSFGDGERRDRRASAGRGDVPLALFNPNTAKDALAAQLAIAEAGPGAVHFPHALRADQGETHPWFEQLAAEARDARNGKWAKKAAHLRNEAWDLLVLAGVTARLHGLHRLDWSQPPGWAADWPLNTQIGAPTLPAAPASAAGVVTPPPAPAAAPLAPPPPVLPRQMPPPPGLPAAAIAASRFAQPIRSRFGAPR